MGAGARSGATTFPSSGSMPHAGGAFVEEKEKKKLDPRLFFVGGGLLVAGLIFAFTNGLLGGGPPAEAGPAPTDPPGTTGPVTINVQPQTPTTPTVITPNTPNTPTIPPVPPEEVRYSVVVPPSPSFATATLAITPTSPVASANAAAGLAKSARDNLQKSGKWTNFQIAVFPQPEDAGTFKDYMNARRGKPLGPQQYAELTNQNAWKGASTFYVSQGRSEHAYSPSANPNWWTSIR